MAIPKLRKRRRYRFEHKRKGIFEGIFLAKEKAGADDPQDKEFLRVAIDTSDGSGSELIRRAKGAQSTLTNIRPSLLTAVEEVRTDG